MLKLINSDCRKKVRGKEKILHLNINVHSSFSETILLLSRQSARCKHRRKTRKTFTEENLKTV